MKGCGLLKTILLFLGLFFFLFLKPQEFIRESIEFPSVNGYNAYKCDFHTHTVFSDGLVWPSVRMREAWADGLDVISITDHLEYTPFSNDINSTDYNRSWIIANNESKRTGILCIRGIEITKEMPIGHYNAIFTSDNNNIFDENYIISLKKASAQKAFIIWNHPAWRQENNIPVWSWAQEEVFKNGLMHGIEVVNDNYYAPLAFEWALKKNLTIIGCSDLHHPANLKYKEKYGNKRPITLVFAKEKTEESIKEALFARRTAVCFNNILIGREEIIEPLFSNSIQILTYPDTIYANKNYHIKIRNNSTFSYELTYQGDGDIAYLQENEVIYGGQISIIRIKTGIKLLSGTEINIPITVSNALVAPDKALTTVMKINTIVVGN